MPLRDRSTDHPGVPTPRGPLRAVALAAAAALIPLLDCPALAQRGADPTSSYAALFGAEEKRVAGTSATKDDAKFAAGLLEKAKNLADDKALLDVIYLKAYDFGIKDPEGYATAGEALKLMGGGSALTREQVRPKQEELLRLQLKKGTPEQRAAAANALIDATLAEADRLAEARKYAEAAKRYKEAGATASVTRSPRAEEIEGRVKEAQARQATHERVQRLQPKIDAGDAAAIAQAFEMSLLDLDDPAAAARLADKVPDAAAPAQVALAAKDLKNLNGQELLLMASWYRAVSSKASTAGKGTAMIRAVRYYEQFLTIHDRQDAERLAAEKAFYESSASLASLVGAAVADRIVLWNPFNAGYNDRGTTVANVTLAFRGRTVWAQQGLRLPIAAGKDVATTIEVPAVAFDVLRVDVVAWHHTGAGLSEIQVFRGDKNVARVARADASGSYSPEFPAASLIDGSTDSSIHKRGYWLAPDREAAWAQLTFKKAGGR